APGAPSGRPERRVRGALVPASGDSVATDRIPIDPANVAGVSAKRGRQAPLSAQSRTALIVSTTPSRSAPRVRNAGRGRRGGPFAERAGRARSRGRRARV